MIEKLNKTGVSYKPSNLEEDEENLYGGINESSNDVGRPQKEFVYQKDDSDRFRTPSKMNLQKDDNGVDVTSRENTPFYCTSEYWDSFKGDMDDPVQVPEVSDEKAATSLETDEIASHASVGSQGVQEEVEEVTGRRKRRGHNMSSLLMWSLNRTSEQNVLRKEVSFLCF